MTNKGKLETIGGKVRESVNGVSAKIVILPLFTIADNRRAGGLKALNSIPDGFLIKRLQGRIVAIHFGKRFD
jgi:hypothetical protein